MQDNGRGIDPLQWKRNLPEEAVQRQQNVATYLQSDAWMHKMSVQNALEEERLRRAMLRDSHKSYLRREEQEEKRRRRELYSQISIRDNTLLITKYNGVGDVLSERKVLQCRILDAERFRYEGNPEILWRVTLEEERSGLIVFSPLYGEKELHFTAKLRRTILGSYDCADVKDEADLWKYIYELIVSILNSKSVIELPAAPGWYWYGDGYHFYTAADKDTSLFNRFMLGFQVNRFDGLEGGDTMSEVLNHLDQITDKGVAGMLLINRFMTFLGRLTGENCFRTGIVIWGENAEEVARHYLRTMSNEVDIINLDCDRVDRIRGRVCSLQDTAVIFLVSDPGNRSVQNRLSQVISWMQTSLIEERRVKVPFVFCLRKFSIEVSLDDMVVIDTAGIVLHQHSKSLDKLQYFVMEMVEKSGTYWVAEIRRKYGKNREAGMGQTMALMRTIGEILLNMIDSDRISEELFRQFQELLDAGMREMEGQLSRKTGQLTELFRDKVKDLVDIGEIEIYDRDKAPTNNERDHIYFDHECYYFTTEVLKNVCKLSEIDKKSSLHIKKELRLLSMLKMYQATGCRQEEMNIDFRIYNAYGQCKDLSGLAIKREFWDEIGGIALCER